MEHGNDEMFIDPSHLPMYGRNFHSRHEFCHGEASQGDDDPGIDGIYLPIQVFIAGSQFIRKRIPVSRRPAFDHISNPNIGTFHPSLGEQFIQELSRGSHERTPLFIFIKTRSLANEHDL